PNDIAIKKDIAQFLDIPESTLDGFLRKHKTDIRPIKLDLDTIRSIVEIQWREVLAKIFAGFDLHFNS
ncbi:hypothetical protein TI03_07235, partial [Achromatium sp. WMS1]